MFHQLKTVLVLAVLAPLSLGAPQFFSSAPPLKSISLRRIYDSLNKAFIGGYSIDVADKEVDLSKYTVSLISAFPVLGTRTHSRFCGVILDQ